MNTQSHTSISEAVSSMPSLLSDAERQMLKAADRRNVLAAIKAEREAQIPSPYKDGWEF